MRPTRSTCSPWTATGSVGTLSSAAAAGRPRCSPRWRGPVSTEIAAPLVAASLDELVAGATDRVAVRSSDAKSGARFETLRLDGQACFLKVLTAEDDWIMRVTGNTTNWEFQVWRAGGYPQAPGGDRPPPPGKAAAGNGAP